LAGGLNLYGFAEGDHINFSDPFGLCPIAEIHRYGALRTTGHSACPSTGDPSVELRVLPPVTLALIAGLFAAGPARFGEVRTEITARKVVAARICPTTPTRSGPGVPNEDDVNFAV
jgi:hypothetical protein